MVKLFFLKDAGSTYTCPNPMASMQELIQIHFLLMH